MELYQIKYFLELKKHQHMSITADLLHISQPALSRSIAALERELGIQLFDRVGKRIKLNKNGEQFAIYAEKAIKMLDLGVESAKNIHYEMTGQISILNYAYAPILAGCSASYAKLNPYVSMMISQFSLGQNLKSNENPDFILCTSEKDSFSGRQEQFWVGEPLLEEEYLLAASPELLPLPEGETEVCLEELRKYPFITMAQKNIFFQDATYSLCQNAGFFTNALYQTDSYEVKLDLAARGLGLAILPEITIKKKQAQFPDLRAYHIKNCPSRHHICLLRQKKALMSEAALDFWDYVLDFFERPRDTRD